MPRQGKPRAAMGHGLPAMACHGLPMPCQACQACHGLPRQGKPRAAMAMPWHATGCLAKACHGQPRQWHRLQWPCQGLPWKRQRREWRWLQQPCQDNAKAMQCQGNAKACQWVTRQCRVSWLEMMSRGMLLAIRADGASVTQCLRCGLGATRCFLMLVKPPCLACCGCMAWLAPCLCIELSSVLPLNYVPSVVRRLGLNSGSCVAYLLERNQTLSLPIPCRCSLRGVGRTMKSSMCPTAASLRCVVVVDHVGVLVLSVAEHNVVKKLVVEPWVGQSGPPLVCTGLLVPSTGDALLALTGRVVPPVLLL
uniref:Uncharacterized protein n=1 Tax=Fagus sylvatica TaxID=28930 RepID=A0A2N9HEH0_FAGSY